MQTLFLPGAAKSEIALAPRKGLGYMYRGLRSQNVGGGTPGPHSAEAPGVWRIASANSAVHKPMHSSRPRSASFSFVSYAQRNSPPEGGVGAMSVGICATLCHSTYTALQKPDLDQSRHLSLCHLRFRGRNRVLTSEDAVSRVPGKIGFYWFACACMLGTNGRISFPSWRRRFADGHSPVERGPPAVCRRSDVVLDNFSTF